MNDKYYEHKYLGTQYDPIRYYKKDCFRKNEKSMIDEMIQITIKHHPNYSFKLPDYENYKNIIFLDIIINNEFISIKYLTDQDTYSCIISNENYKHNYTIFGNFKNIFMFLIRKHNFVKNYDDLFEMIKNKIYILKIYFTNITDIYKHMLPIIFDTHLFDDNIFLELFFKQSMESIVCQE